RRSGNPLIVDEEGAVAGEECGRRFAESAVHCQCWHRASSAHLVEETMASRNCGVVLVCSTVVVACYQIAGVSMNGAPPAGCEVTDRSGRPPVLIVVTPLCHAPHSPGVTRPAARHVSYQLAIRGGLKRRDQSIDARVAKEALRYTQLVGFLL